MGTLRDNLKLFCLLTAVILAGCSRPKSPQTPIHARFSRDGEGTLIDVTQPGFVHDDLVRVVDGTVRFASKDIENRTRRAMTTRDQSDVIRDY